MFLLALQRWLKDIGLWYEGLDECDGDGLIWDEANPIGVCVQVKADRDEVPDVDEDISKLQEQTTRAAQEEVKK